MLQPAISKHLSVSENAGLVWCEKRGDDHIAELPCTRGELQQVGHTFGVGMLSCTRPKGLDHTGKAAHRASLPPARGLLGRLHSTTHAIHPARWWRPLRTWIARQSREGGSPPTFAPTRATPLRGDRGFW